MWLQVLKTFSDVVWHGSWSITGDILAVSGADNKVRCIIMIPGGNEGSFSMRMFAIDTSTSPSSYNSE